jgi:phosphoglycolate phosphatase-like HAD superfamily hydrolase
MIRAVIIDFDDTLCLTEEICFALENESLRRMGRPPMSRALHIATWGRPLFEVITERSPGIDPEEFRKAYTPTLHEFVDNGKLDAIPAQNYAALDRLIMDGKQVMLLTSREHAELKHILEPDHGLASRVIAFYYRENTQFHKPDPRVFDELLADHNLKPDECLYVGDSPSDATAAIEAGVHFAASLEAGIRTRDDFAQYGVDAFITEFPGVVGVVAQLDIQAK